MVEDQTNRERGRPQGAPSDLRVIGLEIRVRDPRTGQQEEVQLLPLEIDLPRRPEYGYGRWELNMTVHTSIGDVNPPSVILPW